MKKSATTNLITNQEKSHSSHDVPSSISPKLSLTPSNGLDESFKFMRLTASSSACSSTVNIPTTNLSDVKSKKKSNSANNSIKYDSNKKKDSISFLVTSPQTNISFVGDNPRSSSSTQTLSAYNCNNENSGETQKPPKLVSPYGDWCGFTGGGGSGGCIITGPYEPMIVAKDDYSDESFESTEESDANVDFEGPIGITKNNFSNFEVVWAKRPVLPWFPGIIIDPHSLIAANKETKDLMKHLSAPMPHKDQLADFASFFVTPSPCSPGSQPITFTNERDRFYFVFLFNRKKTWIRLPENKLRPFCKENDRLFLENSPLLSSKYKRELEKAYKKAKKFSKNYES